MSKRRQAKTKDISMVKCIKENDIKYLFQDRDIKY